MPPASDTTDGVGGRAPDPAVRPRRALLIFVDGLGWSGGDPAADPCRDYGGTLFDCDRTDAACRPLDACLGVDGLPQSATGQTTLLCGVNAQAAVGRHVPGFPTAPLRAILREKSIFVQLRDAGRDGIFLNAFRPLFFRLPRAMQGRLSATTVAHLAADRPFFGLDDLAAGRAVYQEFTNRELIGKGFDVPQLTPDQAGRILGRETLRRDFTLYEYFQTDRAGHAQDRPRAHAVLQDLDTFVRAALSEIAAQDAAPETLVLLTSDHGNLEDLSTRSHTRNPVPLLAWGPGSATLLARCTRLDEVTPVLLSLLVV